MAEQLDNTDGFGEKTSFSVSRFVEGGTHSIALCGGARNSLPVGVNGVPLKPSDSSRIDLQPNVEVEEDNITHSQEPDVVGEYQDRDTVKGNQSKIKKRPHASSDGVLDRPTGSCLINQSEDDYTQIRATPASRWGLEKPLEVDSDVDIGSVDYYITPNLNCGTSTMHHSTGSDCGTGTHLLGVEPKAEYTIANMSTDAESSTGQDMTTTTTTTDTHNNNTKRTAGTNTTKATVSEPTTASRLTVNTVTGHLNSTPPNTAPFDDVRRSPASSAKAADGTIQNGKSHGSSVPLQGSETESTETNMTTQSDQRQTGLRLSRWSSEGRAIGAGMIVEEDAEEELSALRKKVASLTEMLVERDADVRTRMNGNAVRDLVIHIATWNLGNARPPDDLEAWAAPDKGCDIIAVGVQESVYEDDKEQLLTKLTVACGDRYVFLSRTGMFSSASHKIPKKGRQYADNIKLFIFISREHIGHIVKLTKDSVPTGIGVDYGLGHNKGGVGISFGLYGKRYCFINSHLAAHQDRVEERNQDYRIISGKLLDRHDGFSVLMAHHYVFWMGDLNYRIDASYDSVRALIAQQNYAHLFIMDQLRAQRTSELSFVDFHEGVIRFAPTFKVIKGTVDYDVEGLRVPSWCDRILWRVRPGCQVRCEEYSSVPSISTSDHTPVFGRYVALGSSHVPRATGLTPLRLHISNLSVEFTHSLPDEEADDKTTEDGDMIWSDIDLKGGAARQGWVVLLGNDRIKDLIVLAKDLSKPQHGEVDLWYANEKELRTATVELVVMSVHKGKEGKDNKAKRKYSLGECSIPLQDVGMKEMRYDLWRSGVVVGFLRAVFSVVTLYSETKRRPSRVKDETHDAYISPAVETRTLSGLLEVARVDSGGYFSDSGGIGTERPSMTNRSKSSLSQPDLALESTPPDSGRVSPRSKKKSILHKLKPTTPSGSSKRKSLNVKRSSATAPVRPFSVHSDFRFTPDERESAMDFTRSLAQVGRVCTCGNMSDCLKCKATGSKALRDSLKSCKDKILSNFKVELDGTSRRRIAVDNKDKLMREILREEAIIYNSTHSQHTGTQHSSTSSLTADSNGREVSKAPVHALSPITSPEVQGKGTPGDTDRGRQYVRMLSTEVPAKRGKDHKGKKKRNRDRSASDGSHKKFDPAMLVLPLTSLSRPKSPKGKRSPLISSQSMQNTTTHTIHTTPNYTAHQHTHADTYDHTSRQAQLAASTSDDLRVVMPTYEPFYSQPSPPVSSRKSRTRLKKIGSDGHSDSEVIDSKVTASTRSSLLDRMKPTRKRSISKQETQRDKEESASLLVNCDSPVGLRNVLCEPFMLGMDSANSAPASVGSSAVGSPNALTPTGSGGSQSNGDHGGSSRRSGGKDKHKSGHRTSVTNKVNRIFGRKSSDLQVTDIPPQDTSSRAGSHTKPSVQSVVLNKLRSISPRQSNVDVWAAPLLSDDLNDRDREMPRRNSATKVITPHSTNALPSTASSPGIILDSSAQAHAHERRRSTSSDVHGMTQNTTYHPNDSPPSQANAPTDDMQHHTSAEALTFDDLQSAGHSSEHKRYSSIVADLNSPTVSEAGGPSNSSTGGTDGDRNKILQKFKRHTKGDKDKDAKECKPVKEFRDGKLGRDHKDHNGSKRDKKDRRDKRCDKSVERTKDMQVQLSSSNWNYPSVDEI